MTYRPSEVAQSPRLFQNPWRTLTFLGPDDVRYLYDASAGSGGTGADGTIVPEEVGVCERDGVLEEDLDGVELRGGERALSGESALIGEVVRGLRENRGSVWLRPTALPLDRAMSLTASEAREMLVGGFLDSRPSRESRRVDEYGFSETGSRYGYVWLRATLRDDCCTEDELV